MICPPPRPDSSFKSFYCNVKYISRRRLKMDFRWNMTKPVYDSWLHGSVYHKFNGITWAKFPIDLWEDMCAWISGKRKAYILDWTFGKILKYTNFNHSCPFYGYYIIDVKNISMEHFDVEQLLPSGQYRLDLEFTQQQGGGDPYTAFSVYFSVTEYRLEIV